MSIGSLGSKLTSTLHLGETARTEKKALPPNPLQNPALRDSVPPMDSFKAGGRAELSPRGGTPMEGDVFQSAPQAAGARAALDLLGGIGEMLTELSEDLGELLSAGGPEGELPMDGPEGELPMDGPEGELSAGGPEGELPMDGLENELSELEPETAKSPPPMTADGRVIPQADDKRPEGDKRSAEQIVKDSPVLDKLGRQKDIKFDQLCKQTGVDPKLDLKDAKQNPDAVYRLSKVLEFIDASPASDGSARPDQVKGGKGDGNIEGLTKDGDARHGTEAGLVKDFAEKGYDFLKSQATLPTTKDSHVRKDGSNKNDFQAVIGVAAKVFSFNPLVGNILSGISNAKGGVGGAIKGALGGAVHTAVDGAKGVIDAVGKGRINPILLGAEVYKSELAGGTETPDAVKDVLNILP